MVFTHKRAPPARATNTKTGGRLTQAPAGTNPTTGQGAAFFNLVGDLKFWQVGTFPEFEVVRCISSGMSTLCQRSCFPSHRCFFFLQHAGHLPCVPVRAPHCRLLYTLCHCETWTELCAYTGAPLVGVSMLRQITTHSGVIKMMHVCSSAKWLPAQGVPPTSLIVRPRS